MIAHLKQKLLLLIIAVAPFSVFALDKQIIGKWNELDGRTVIEFSANNVMLYPEILTEIMISNDGHGYAFDKEEVEFHINADATSASFETGNHWAYTTINIHFHLLSGNVLLLLIRYCANDTTDYNRETGDQTRESHETNHRLILIRG
jgi:hypothetical protein